LHSVILIQLDTKTVIFDKLCKYHNYYEDSSLFFCEYEQDNYFFPFLYDLEKREKVLSSSKMVESWQLDDESFLTVLSKKDTLACFNLQTGKRKTILRGTDGCRIIDYTVKNGVLSVRYSNNNLTIYDVELDEFVESNRAIKMYDCNKNKNYHVILWHNGVVEVKKGKGDKKKTILSRDNVRTFKFDRKKSIVALLYFDRELRLFDLKTISPYKTTAKTLGFDEVIKFDMENGYIWVVFNKDFSQRVVAYNLHAKKPKKVDAAYLDIKDDFVIKLIRPMRDFKSICVYGNYKYERESKDVVKLFRIRKRYKPKFLFERENVHQILIGKNTGSFCFKYKDGSSETIDKKGKSISKNNNNDGNVGARPKKRKRPQRSMAPLSLEEREKKKQKVETIVVDD